MLRDPTGLAIWGKRMAWLWLATEGILALSCIGEIYVLGGLGLPPGTAETIEDAADISALASLPYMLAYIVCGILVARWIHRINRNAHHWSDKMTIGPKWNVGWFFVPGANLWMPFAGIRQTRGATIDSETPDSVPVPDWMRLWWGFWLASTLLGNLTFRLSVAAKTPESLIAVDWLYVVSLVLDVPLTILLCRLLADISTLQSQRIAREADMSGAETSPLP